MLKSVSWKEKYKWWVKSHIFTSLLTWELVATLAYGMGIDKKDIRNVIHYNAARNLEEYSQQVGRSGRDGLSSNCLLLFDSRDIASYKVSLCKRHNGQLTKVHQRYSSMSV